MKLPTRLRILDQLRGQQTASVMELSRIFGMTGANIRHHLSVLEENDLVEVVGQRCEGRGRPNNVYALSRRVLGDGLDELSSALLTEWLGSLSAGDRDAGLHSMARRLGAGFTKNPSDSIPGRLTAMVRFLDQLHYQARWEAGAVGARVILGHCPFAAIIDGHYELCRLDKFLLEDCLGQEVTQSARLEQAGHGLPHCIFLVL